MSKKAAGVSTRAIHAGQAPDPSTGAIMTPIYATSTYVQQSPGVHQGFEYSRTHNPTRFAWERAIAALENGRRGFAFASGMAAIATVLELLGPGLARGRGGRSVRRNVSPVRSRPGALRRPPGHLRRLQ